MMLMEFDENEHLERTSKFGKNQITTEKKKYNTVQNNNSPFQDQEEEKNHQKYWI